MAVFIDTSGLYAMLNARDEYHEAAKAAWSGMAARRETLVTTSYVLLETIALLQRRLGLQAVQDFQTGFVPLPRTHWVDESLHDRALSAMLAARRRDLSLVDSISFQVMSRLGPNIAFAFDVHFAQQGFHCIP